MDGTIVRLVHQGNTEIFVCQSIRIVFIVPAIYNFGFKSVFLSFQIEWPWHCERHCKHVPTDASRNMIILAGDRMLAANCDLATNLKTGTKIWSKEQTPMRNVKNLR